MILYYLIGLWSFWALPSACSVHRLLQRSSKFNGTAQYHNRAITKIFYLYLPHTTIRFCTQEVSHHTIIIQERFSNPNWSAMVAINYCIYNRTHNRSKKKINNHLYGIASTIFFFAMQSLINSISYSLAPGKAVSTNWKGLVNLMGCTSLCSTLPPFR